MMIEVKVPSPGESISQVLLSKWLVADGDMVEKDAEIAEIDSDKATLSIYAAEDGKIKIHAAEGDTVDVGAVVCTIDSSVVAESKASEPKTETKEVVKTEIKAVQQPKAEVKTAKPADVNIHISPLARKVMEENQISEQQLIEKYNSIRISPRKWQTSLLSLLLPRKQVFPAKANIKK